MTTNRLLSWISLVLLLPVTAAAVPVTFQFSTTVLSGGTPGVVDGDLLTLEVIADNGGTDLLSQTWLQVDVLSAVAKVGTYEAVFNYPYFTDPVFITDGLGILTQSSFYDSDGNNTDNLGAGSPGVLSNGLKTSQNIVMFFESNRSSDPGTWTATIGAAIPEPSTVVLMGLGLVGLGYAGRRKLVS